jgi:hypothetical protein
MPLGIVFEQAVDSISENRRWFLEARIGLSATRIVAVDGREKKPESLERS